MRAYIESIERHETMKRVFSLAIGLLALTARRPIFLDHAGRGARRRRVTTLKFESLPPPQGLVGAPPKFKVTKATILHLEKLLKEDKVIEVQGNGALKVIPAKKRLDPPHLKVGPMAASSPDPSVRSIDPIVSEFDACLTAPQRGVVERQ